MRNWITFLMAAVVCSTLSYANANFGQLSFEAGYRQDHLSWSNEFPSNAPVVKTKSKLKEIDIFQLGLQGRTTIGCNFYARGNAYFGWVLDGKFERETTAFNNFASNSGFGNGLGFSTNHKNLIDDRYVYGISAAIGYPFYFCNCTMAVAPTIGYSFDQQSFRVDDRGVDQDSNNGFAIPVDGTCCCPYKYHNRWYGPFVGADFIYRPCGESWDLFGEFEYHWGHFEGRRGVLENFDIGDNGHHHRGHLNGWVVAVGGDYDLGNEWTVGLCLKFKDFRSSKHHDGFLYDFLSDSSATSGRGHMKHKWHSYEVNLALGHSF